MIDKLMHELRISHIHAEPFARIDIFLDDELVATAYDSYSAAVIAHGIRQASYRIPPDPRANRAISDIIGRMFEDFPNGRNTTLNWEEE